MNDCQVIVERWGAPFGYEEKSVPIIDLVGLQVLLESLKQEQSAVVSIVNGANSDDAPTLYIYFSQENYSVSLQKTEHVSLDLVGNQQAQGAMNFISGGQLVPVPHRYIVPFEMVLQVATVFTQTGLTDLPGFWDLYGPNSAWEQI
jgi:hypothetical protein